MCAPKKFKKKNGEKANLTNGRKKKSPRNHQLELGDDSLPRPWSAIRRQPFLQDGTTAANCTFQKQYLKRVNVWYGFHVREWLSVSHSPIQNNKQRLLHLSSTKNFTWRPLHVTGPHLSERGRPSREWCLSTTCRTLSTDVETFVRGNGFWK